jgi:hypothetical protein
MTFNDLAVWRLTQVYVNSTRECSQERRIHDI